MRQKALIACIGITSMLLIGCMHTLELTVGPEHPANAEAAGIGLRSPSTTLAVFAPLPTSSSTNDSDADLIVPPPHRHTSLPEQKPTTSESGSDETAADKPEPLYTCPMHPETISNQPGRCPRCKMKLLRKEASK